MSDNTAKILPVAYGIKKLQISCVIEDDKVGTDFLEESILAFEDLVCENIFYGSKSIMCLYHIGAEYGYSGF